MSCGWERTPDIKLPFRIFRFSYLQIVIMVGLNTNIDEYWSLEPIAHLRLMSVVLWVWLPASCVFLLTRVAPSLLRVAVVRVSVNHLQCPDDSWFLLLQGEHRVILWLENWSPLWSVRKDSPPLDQERPRQTFLPVCNYVFAEERLQHELPPAKTRTDWAAAATTPPCLGKDSRHSWSLNEYNTTSYKDHVMSGRSIFWEQYPLLYAGLL